MSLGIKINVNLISSFSNKYFSFYLLVAHNATRVFPSNLNPFEFTYFGSVLCFNCIRIKTELYLWILKLGMSNGLHIVTSKSTNNILLISNLPSFFVQNGYIVCFIRFLSVVNYYPFFL